MRGNGRVAQRAGVHDGAHLSGAVELGAEDVVAALGEGLAQRQARGFRVERVVLRLRVAAEEPARLVVQAPGLELEVAAAKQQRADGERRAVR